ncbi:antibiotic biosynthesis monooxygenase [Aquitalea magnusonii]|nr:antibiotic biosynthesis monooxygenase [Aquitalea magnusonii]
MIAVISEVWVAVGQESAYQHWAERLRPLLQQMDGFVSSERFHSTSEPGKVLSFSVWRDEAALHAWQQQEQHLLAQEMGRAFILQDYRIRVAQVLRDYSKLQRRSAPNAAAESTEVE